MWKCPDELHRPPSSGLLVATVGADAEPAWSDPAQVAGLAVLSAGKSGYLEIRLSSGTEFALPLSGKAEEIMAQILQAAFREKERVRVFADPQVVILYRPEHGGRTRKRVKALGVRIGS